MIRIKRKLQLKAMKRNALIALLLSSSHVKVLLANIYGYNSGMGATHGAMHSGSAGQHIMQNGHIPTNGLDRDHAMAISPNKIFTTAMTQNISNGISKNSSKNGLGNSEGCSSFGFEGNTEIASDQWKLDCLRKAKVKQEKVENYTKLIEQSSLKGDGNCVKKLDPNVMVCQLEEVAKEVVEKPYYKIAMYGNVVELVEGDDVKMMGVVENLNYDVSKKTTVQKSPMRPPRSLLEFNKLGGLIRQRGEIPRPDKPDPCSSCLEALAKKDSVEGKNEGCGGCDSLVDITNIRSGSFRDVSNKNHGTHDRRGLEHEDD